jgi:hypothetical protein
MSELLALFRQILVVQGEATIVFDNAQAFAGPVEVRIHDAESGKLISRHGIGENERGLVRLLPFTGNAPRDCEIGSSRLAMRWRCGGDEPAVAT